VLVDVVADVAAAALGEPPDADGEDVCANASGARPIARRDGMVIFNQFFLALG